MKKIVWGMIGCGDVTEVKNGPGLYLTKDSELKGITNRTLDKAYDWVKRHKHGIVYSSVEELISDPEIDIIYIATTPNAHKQYAISCAQHGKHCLIEKPLALTYEDGVEIKQAFDEAGKKAFVAFYRRSMLRFQKVRQLLESGSIGAIEGVNIKRYVKAVEDPNAWRMNADISGGNVFTETDIHAIDFMISILGDIQDFNYQKNTFDPKNQLFDSITMNFKFENGLIASGLWLFNCNVTDDCFEIIGQDGIISFDFFHNDKPIYVKTPEGMKEYMVEESAHMGLVMEQDIAKELLGNGHYTGTIEEALKSQLIMDRVVHDK